MAGLRFAAMSHVTGENPIHLDVDDREFNRLVNKTGSSILWETAKDSLSLATRATRNVFKSEESVPVKGVGAILVVSQSPDFVLPGLAPQIQSVFDFRNDILCLDLSLGCAGFVQALLVAERLIETTGPVLIITVDRYRSKIDKSDRSTSAIFSDGASATLLTADAPTHTVGSQFHYTNGSSGDSLMQRSPESSLFMNGRAVFTFTQTIVASQIMGAAKDANVAMSQIDYAFVHQASAVVLSALRSQLGLSEGQLPTELEGVGNTTSSSIPGVMSGYLDRLAGRTLILSGFGVGLACSTIVLCPIYTDTRR